METAFLDFDHSNLSSIFVEVCATLTTSTPNVEAAKREKSMLLPME